MVGLLDFESGALHDLSSPLLCHGDFLDQAKAQQEAFAVKSSGFFKNPVILNEYAFVLIRGVGYGAVSVCPRLLTMIVSCWGGGSLVLANCRS